MLPLTETSKVEEPAVPEVAPASDATAITDAKTEEPIIPAKDEKRRSSFFGLGSLRKPSEKKIVKDETKPAEELVKSDETAKETEVAKPELAAVPVENETPVTPAVASTDSTKDVKATPVKAEKKENAFAGIKRSLSKALHSGEKQKKEKTKPAEKVEEIKEETISEKHTAPTTETVKPTEPAVIGDVVPEAVSVGTPAAPPASSTVQATA